MEILAFDMSGMVTQISNIALAALGLGLVIFLHELGHFAVAKWCDVFVERFSIGFGPVLFSRKWGETEYALSLIPFGGYVKMLGQDDADPSQLTSEEIAEDPRSYVAKTVLQRMAIISAGVTMNVLTAFLFFIIVFLAGLPTLPTDIGKARPGMPAWEAGILAGDQVDRIDNHPIVTYYELQMSVAFSVGPLKLNGRHLDGKEFEITANPDTTQSHPQIGVIPMESLLVRESSPGTSISHMSEAFMRDDLIKKVGDVEVTNAVEFHRALVSHPGPTIDITVDRTIAPDKSAKEPKDPEVVTKTITITNNYFRTLGFTLDSGPIAAIRKGSPAEKAGLQKGDKLAKLDGLNIGTDIDPLKLPVEFFKRAGTEVTIEVARQPVGGGQEKVELKLVPDPVPGWLERPTSQGEPLAIDSIGVAFHILPNVLSVTPGSSAEKEGLKPGSSQKLKKLSLVKRADATTGNDSDKDLVINFEDSKNEVNTNNFAYAFWEVQRKPLRKVVLTVVENDKTREIEVVPELDTTWPMPEIGLELQAKKLVQKADSLAEAIAMSIKHTRNSALNTYLTLRSLFTGRVSVKELHGPIKIAEAAYHFASEGWVAMLVFLGFLSMNLAVLNFLPIPVLDGGHMVFLMWEAFTGRKPNEKVLIAATFVGFAFLIGLMGLVIYLDIFVHGFSKK